MMLDSAVIYYSCHPCERGKKGTLVIFTSVFIFFCSRARRHRHQLYTEKKKRESEMSETIQFAMIARHWHPFIHPFHPVK